MKITDAIHEFILYKQSLGMSCKNRALKLNAFARLAGPIEIDSDLRLSEGDVDDDGENKRPDWLRLFQKVLPKPLALGKRPATVIAG